MCCCSGSADSARSYCEGGDLAAYLKHKKGIPMRDGEVLYHFVQMAMALLFMHDKKILHRSGLTNDWPIGRWGADRGV